MPPSRTAASSWKTSGYPQYPSECCAHWHHSTVPFLPSAPSDRPITANITLIHVKPYLFQCITPNPICSFPTTSHCNGSQSLPNRYISSRSPVKFRLSAFIFWSSQVMGSFRCGNHDTNGSTPTAGTRTISSSIPLWWPTYGSCIAIKADLVMHIGDFRKANLYHILYHMLQKKRDLLYFIL